MSLSRSNFCWRFRRLPFEKLEAADQIRSRILELKRLGMSHDKVAASLNAEGFHSAGGGPFTVPIISQLCRKLRVQGIVFETGDAASHFWTLTALASVLGMSADTLNTWRRRAWINATRLKNRWMLWADEEELIRLRKLAEYKRTPLQKTPKELTTPKQQPSPQLA